MFEFRKLLYYTEFEWIFINKSPYPLICYHLKTVPIVCAITYRFVSPIFTYMWKKIKKISRDYFIFRLFAASSQFVTLSVVTYNIITMTQSAIADLERSSFNELYLRSGSLHVVIEEIDVTGNDDRPWF